MKKKNFIENTIYLKFLIFYSTKQYKVFDVYNNGYKWGGKLKVIFNKYLIHENNNHKIYTTKSNINSIQRKSLNDITLRIGMDVICFGSYLLF